MTRYEKLIDKAEKEGVDFMEYNITYRQKDKGWQYIISMKENGKWRQVKSKQ